MFMAIVDHFRVKKIVAYMPSLRLPFSEILQNKGLERSKTISYSYSGHVNATTPTLALMQQL